MSTPARAVARFHLLLALLMAWVFIDADSRIITVPVREVALGWVVLCGLTWLILRRSA